MAVADLMSLSPTTQSKKVEVIKTVVMTTRMSELKELIAVCLERDLFDYLARLLDSSLDEQDHDCTHEIVQLLQALVNMSTPAVLGALLDCGGLAEALCRAFTDAQPDAVATEAAWLLGCLADIDRDAADALVRRGVFARVCGFMSELYSDNDAPSFGKDLNCSLAWILSKFACATPALSPSVLVTMVPLLGLVLHRVVARPHAFTAQTLAVKSLAHIFDADCDPACFENLVAGGEDSVFHAVLADLGTDHSGPRAALLLVAKVAALKGDVAERVFTPAVLERLRAFASRPASNGTDGFKEQLMAVVSHLMCKGPAMAARVFASNLLQTVLARVPPPPHKGQSWHILWTFMNAMSTMVAAVLHAASASDDSDGGSRLAMALLLHDAGVMSHCVKVIAAATATSVLPPTTLVEVIALMIASGDTNPDPAVLGKGAKPRNVFLDVFLAEGGLGAMMWLRQRKFGQASTTKLDSLVEGILGGIGKGNAVP